MAYNRSAGRLSRAAFVTGYGALVRNVVEVGSKSTCIGDVAADAVRVRVQAASLNRLDLAMTNGYGRSLFECLRASSRFPYTPGLDCSGEVGAVGSLVTSYRPGDPVMGFLSPALFDGQGTMAEYVDLPADLVCRRPANLSATDAAAIPFAALSAWSAIEPSAGDQASQVLVLGGSGGVGLFAIQILKRHLKCASVVATCRPDNAALCSSAGADRTIDHGGQDQLEEQSIDLVLDLSGRDADLRDANVLRCIKPGGRYTNLSSHMLSSMDTYKSVLVGGLMATAGYVQRAAQIKAERQIRYDNSFLIPCSSMWKTVADLAHSGVLTTHCSNVFPLENVVDAFECLQDRRPPGKVVIEIEQD